MLEFFKEIVQSNPALATMYSGGIVAMFVMHSKVIFGWVYTKLISLISFSIDNKITVIQGYNEIKRIKRPLTSVYTNDNIGNKILNDIKHFLKSKNDYIINNILYKRNYLLYGVPGTGKKFFNICIGK